MCVCLFVCLLLLLLLFVCLFGICFLLVAGGGGGGCVCVEWVWRQAKRKQNKKFINQTLFCLFACVTARLPAAHPAHLMMPLNRPFECLSVCCPLPLFSSPSHPPPPHPLSPHLPQLPVPTTCPSDLLPTSISMLLSLLAVTQYHPTSHSSLIYTLILDLQPRSHTLISGPA